MTEKDDPGTPVLELIITAWRNVTACTLLEVGERVLLASEKKSHELQRGEVIPPEFHQTSTSISLPTATCIILSILKDADRGIAPQKTKGVPEWQQ